MVLEAENTEALTQKDIQQVDALTRSISNLFLVPHEDYQSTQFRTGFQELWLDALTSSSSPHVTPQFAIQEALVAHERLWSRFPRVYEFFKLPGMILAQVMMFLPQVIKQWDLEKNVEYRYTPKSRSQSLQKEKASNPELDAMEDRSDLGKITETSKLNDPIMIFVALCSLVAKGPNGTAIKYRPGSILQIKYTKTVIDASDGKLTSLMIRYEMEILKILQYNLTSDIYRAAPFYKKLFPENTLWLNQHILLRRLEDEIIRYPEEPVIWQECSGTEGDRKPVSQGQTAYTPRGSKPLASEPHRVSCIQNQHERPAVRFDK